MDIAPLHHRIWQQIPRPSMHLLLLLQQITKISNRIRSHNPVANPRMFATITMPPFNSSKVVEGNTNSKIGSSIHRIDHHSTTIIINRTWVALAAEAMVQPPPTPICTPTTILHRMPIHNIISNTTISNNNHLVVNRRMFVPNNACHVAPLTIDSRIVKNPKIWPCLLKYSRGKPVIRHYNCPKR